MNVCVCVWWTPHSGSGPSHFPLGEVQLTVRHSSQRNKLVVVLHACRYTSTPLTVYCQLRCQHFIFTQHSAHTSTTYKYEWYCRFTKCFERWSLSESGVLMCLWFSLLRNLISFTESGSDPYVRLYLLPDKRRSGRRKTHTHKKSLNPVYDQTWADNTGL